MRVLVSLPAARCAHQIARLDIFVVDLIKDVIRVGILRLCRVMSNRDSFSFGGVGFFVFASN